MFDFVKLNYLDVEPCEEECCAETVAEHDDGALVVAELEEEFRLAEQIRGVTWQGRPGDWDESVEPFGVEPLMAVVDETLLGVAAERQHSCAVVEFPKLVAEQQLLMVA